MATISIANFKTIIDSIAKQAEILKAAVGTDGTESGTSGKGASDNLDRILALDDEDQETALLGPARAALDTILSTNAMPRLLKELVRGMDNHVSGLNDFLATNDERVHWLIDEIVSNIQAANIFPPVVDPIISFAVTGATTGTPTPGTAIDTTKYGKANLRVKATTAISTTVATFTCKKIDGTTEEKQVDLTGFSQDQEADIGTHDTDMYVDVTAITITGGTNGEGFKVLSELERAIAL